MSTATAVGLRSKRRRLIAILALVTASALALAMSALFTQSKSEAHGANVFPGSRQYFCYFDALTETGGLDPYNAACRNAANEAGGVSGPGGTALYNWFAVLDSNGAGRTEGYIPDGQLCNGANRGPYDFSGYNDARSDWPKTHVTSGATYQWRHNNWAHHPGRFDLYITNDGWNPNEPIGWDDITKFATIQDPPSSGGPGQDGNYYYANMTLPQKSGYHIIFTHWVRSDSPENFYSCSDMMFDGGDGEVSGIRPGANLPGNDGGVVDPPTDPTTSDGGTTTPAPTGDCAATAQVNSWGSGATVHITVTNTGDANIGDWMIHWMWPANSGIAITQNWSSEISTMGDMQMASPASWNASIASGASVNFGFNVSGSLSQMPQMDCYVT